MSKQETYLRFIDWLKQTLWGLPEADELMPLMIACYTPEEASLLTGMPFSGRMTMKKVLDRFEELGWLRLRETTGCENQRLREALREIELIKQFYEDPYKDPTNERARKFAQVSIVLAETGCFGKANVEKEIQAHTKRR